MNAVPPGTTREHCLAYFDLGWGLIPLLPGLKKPYEEDWPSRACKELVDLNRFGRKDNVGVILGKPSKYLIDVDEDCEEVRRLGDLLPGTRCTFGRVNIGVTHRFYYLAEHIERFTEWVGWSYHPDPKQREKLIELRYEGRQTMLPGSIHPDGDRPFWVSWPPPPPTVVDLRDLEAACRLVAAITIIKRAWPQKNNRDDFAHRVIGGLVFHNVPAEQAQLMVARAAQLAGDEEWKGRGDSAERAARKVKAGDKVKGFTSIETDWKLPGWGRFLLDTLGVAPQALTGPGADDRPVPKPDRGTVKPTRRVVLRPWVPFPCEYLPSVMREMVLAVATARNVDPTLVALPALVTAAACVGATCQITPNDDWLEECCLWAIPICESGTRKTPAYSAALSWVHQEQRRRIREYEGKKQEYRDALAEWQNTREGAKPQKPDPPQRLMTTDATIEGLTRALAVSPRGIIYAAEEADTWFSSFARYSQETTAYYLSLYNGAPIEVIRATQEMCSVARPLVNFCGAIQPVMLARTLTEQNVYSGLLGRCVLAYPPATRNRFVRRPPRIKDDLKAWREMCKSLHEIPWGDTEKMEPSIISVSDHALDLYEDWHNRLDDRLFDAEHGPVKIADNKLYGIVLRLALVHHLCSAIAGGTDTRKAVGVESIQAATALGDWFSEEHARIYPYLLSGEASVVPDLCERVLGYFVKRPGLSQDTIRNIRNALKDRHGQVTVETVTEAARQLESEGRGTVTVTGPEGNASTTFAPTMPVTVWDDE